MGVSLPEGLGFPYDFREGQEEALRFIAMNAGWRNVCLNAPTGFGKTVVILSALLPRRAPIIWAVRTGNEADRPVEELKLFNERCGCDFFGFSFRGKRDMCLLAREMEVRDPDAVSYLCRVKKGKGECRYYENLKWFDTEPMAEKPLIYAEVMEACSREEVCPYYAQQRLLPLADLVALSYNYIVNEEMSWTIRSRLPSERCFLVVDEAHNLRLAGSINSDEVTMGTLQRAVRELEELGTRTANQVKGVVEDVVEEAERLHLEMRRRGVEEEEVDIFRFLNACLDHLDSMRRLGRRVRAVRLAEGKAPRSSLHHLAEFLVESLRYVDERGVAFIATAKGGFRVERWDMRSAELLRGRWRGFAGCVFCSGTLRPLDAFAETIGLDNWVGGEFKAKLGSCETLIIRGVSTRGEELSRMEVEKYLKLLDSFLNLEANVAVFSASYRVQGSLLPGIRRLAEEKGRNVYVEEQGMSGGEGRRLLDGFKRDRRGVLVATMTGRFAEGADFPGRELEAVFLAGIPFERMTLKTRLYLKYYGELYGEEKGRYYAYIVPALLRASQSLGRAIRSEGDRALFILADERYEERTYFKLLPDYVKENVGAVNLEDAEEAMENAWVRLGLKGFRG
nr:ATP-dependent DNA helicase [Candidatus Freyrarchaeum guaymaensis]